MLWNTILKSFLEFKLKASDHLSPLNNQHHCFIGISSALLLFIVEALWLPLLVFHPLSLIDGFIHHHNRTLHQCFQDHILKVNFVPESDMDYVQCHVVVYNMTLHTSTYMYYFFKTLISPFSI